MADDAAQPQRRVGATAPVVAAFDDMPVALAALEGPDLRWIAANRAIRKLLRRSDLVGTPLRSGLCPEGDPLPLDLVQRAYDSGQTVTAHEWRIPVRGADGERHDCYYDFEVVPRAAQNGSHGGVLVQAMDVTTRVQQRHRMEEAAAQARQRFRAVRDVVLHLQEALLPSGLPVLPRARIAASYLVAAQDQAAGGDWYDAIPLADGHVALVVGDLVGHGVSASAAMGQLRAVLKELVHSHDDLSTVMERLEEFVAGEPAMRGATVAVVVLEPATGALQYVLRGHPPPLVVSPTGETRELDGTDSGPLGTGTTWRVGRDLLPDGHLVLLYSDGLVERTGRALQDGVADLARVARRSVTTRAAEADGFAAVTDRLCRDVVGSLTRAGYDDDVTALAAQRRTSGTKPVALQLPARMSSLRTIRREFGSWLDGVGVVAAERGALQVVLEEAVLNVIEHAYPPGEPGRVWVEARLEDGGCLEVRVTDRGRWQVPDRSDRTRGRGLVMCRSLVEEMRVLHTPHPTTEHAGTRGTVVVFRHRLHRSADLTSGDGGAVSTVGHDAAFTVETSARGDLARGDLARGDLVRVTGPVDATTAGEFRGALHDACRGGVIALTVDLGAVTLLGSAGVRVLLEVAEQLTQHRQELTLVAPDGSPAASVLDVVNLPRTSTDRPDQRPSG